LAYTKKYQRRKTIGYEILSVVGKILATFTGFQLLLPDSGGNGQILANLGEIWSTRIWRRWADVVEFWRKLPNSSTSWILACIARIWVVGFWR
jgi:hypothetical protein